METEASGLVLVDLHGCVHLACFCSCVHLLLIFVDFSLYQCTMGRYCLELTLHDPNKGESESKHI